MVSDRLNIGRPRTRAVWLRWPALAVGLVGTIVCILAASFGGTPFFRAYLYGYLFWLGITLGSLCIIMIHNLTGGAWGTAIRRAADAASLTMPLMAILFIPVILGMNDLYAWVQPATGGLLQHRSMYLNGMFFIGRAFVYFAAWMALALLLSYWTRQWSFRQDIRSATKIRRASGAGLVIYLITITHAAIDWVMSRDTEFYSTIFGFILATGQAVSAMAFLIVTFYTLPDESVPAIDSPRQPAEALTGQRLSIDLGNMLLTMVILWAYIAFFQLLVIWMGNTREDNTWYLQRGFGQPSAWRWVAIGLVIFHFFVPLFFLLFRAIKRRPGALAGVAASVLIAHLVEQYWIVAPSGPHTRPIFDLHWIDFVTPLAIGGVWLFFFFSIYDRRPLLLPPQADKHSSGEIAHA
jgi:hypothetical protein